MTDLAGFATDVVAVHRLTRLATRDTLLYGVRERVIHAAYVANGTPSDTQPWELGQHDPDPNDWADLAEREGPHAPKVAQLVTCGWCASVWIAAGVLAARRLAPRAWNPVARLLAASTVANLLATLED